MARQPKNNKQKKKGTQQIVDLDQLRSLGITRDPTENEGIEEIEGSELLGGKGNPRSEDVCQNWPTTMGGN